MIFPLQKIRNGNFSIWVAFNLFVILVCSLIKDGYSQNYDSEKAGFTSSLWAQRWNGDLVDYRKIEFIRFVAGKNYPPFNYVDLDNNLIGFNVDLARAICDELQVRCSMKSQIWENLSDDILSKNADIAIASQTLKGNILKNFLVSDVYFRMSARFVARKKVDVFEINYENLRKKNIGVVAFSAHEKFIEDLFPSANITKFANRYEVLTALKIGKLNLAFVDNVSTMYWLDSISANNCCEFRGEIYSNSNYFGAGMVMVISKDNRELTNIINYGLWKVARTGKYKELLLKYFPNKPF